MKTRIALLFSCFIGVAVNMRCVAAEIPTHQEINFGIVESNEIAKISWNAPKPKENHLYYINLSPYEKPKIECCIEIDSKIVKNKNLYINGNLPAQVSTGKITPKNEDLFYGLIFDEKAKITIVDNQRIILTTLDNPSTEYNITYCASSEGIHVRINSSNRQARKSTKYYVWADMDIEEGPYSCPASMTSDH